MLGVMTKVLSPPPANPDIRKFRKKLISSRCHGYQLVCLDEDLALSRFCCTQRVGGVGTKDGTNKMERVKEKLQLSV